MLNDPTSILYVLTAIVSLYGLVLFLWWWIYNGDASSIYASVSILFAGECVDSIVSLQGRYLVLCGDVNGFIEFTKSYVWSGRLIFVLTALIMIVGILTVRIFKEKKGRK